MADKPTIVEEAPRARQTRVVFIQRRTSAAVDRLEEDMVMTFPHLVVREIIALELLVLGVMVFSMVFDAPLEWIANPEHTPNPAKAPWYFLGLQELLHYFPPVVAGVLLPTLVVIALVVIPYFEINLKRTGLWETGSPAHTLRVVVAAVAGVAAFFAFFHVWSIVACTLIVGALMLWPYFVRRRHGFVGRLARQPLAHWVMTWFVLVATVLTITGTYFRGPGWSFVWPWEMTRHP